MLDPIPTPFFFLDWHQLLSPPKRLSFSLSEEKPLGLLPYSLQGYCHCACKVFTALFVRPLGSLPPQHFNALRPYRNRSSNHWSPAQPLQGPTKSPLIFLDFASCKVKLTAHLAAATFLFLLWMLCNCNALLRVTLSSSYPMYRVNELIQLVKF